MNLIVRISLRISNKNHWRHRIRRPIGLLRRLLLGWISENPLTADNLVFRVNRPRKPTRLPNRNPL